MEKFQLYRTALDALQFLVGLDYFTDQQRIIIKNMFEDTIEYMSAEFDKFEPKKG